MAKSEPKSSREKVLQTLLMREQCTITDLAEAVEINPISIRHHIAKLEAEGLVDSEEERHGVGRPRRLYFLTEKGREQFPTRYIRLTVRLLEQLKEVASPAFIRTLFTQMAKDMANEYRAEALDLTIDERFQLVQKLLTREGFSVEIEKQGGYYYIRESSCPYFHIGVNHPEVCSVDQTLISTLLGVPAQKIQCLLQGDAACTYLVQTEAVTKNDIPIIERSPAG